MRDLPIILNPEAIVIVAQMDVIGLWSKAANGEEEEKAGVDRAELLVVSFGGEQLIILEVGFDTVNVCVFVVPTELDGVAIEVLHKASAEGAIFLL
jgi:hypothetical protein